LAGERAYYFCKVNLILERDPPENQVHVPVAIECTSLDIEESNQVLHHDEPFPFQIDSLGAEFFFLQLSLCKLLHSLVSPMSLTLLIALHQGSDYIQVLLPCTVVGAKKRIVLFIGQLEDPLRLLLGKLYVA